MGFMGKLFGTDKAIDNLLDKNDGLLVRAGGWVDGLSHTDQEKDESKQKTREWGLRQLEALAPFKIVQRLLAFAASGMWLVVGINVIVALWVEALNPKIKIADSMKELAASDFIFWPVSIVFALYFSGGVINSLKSGKG